MSTTKSDSSATSATSSKPASSTKVSAATTAAPEITGMTIIGPFPTSYRPPDRCTAVSKNAIIGLDFASTCLPDDFVTHRSAFYSPGIACPPGYTAQSTCTKSSGSRTTITCCPTRVNFGFTLSCLQSPELKSQAWVDMMCTWSAGSTTTVVLVTTTSGTKVITSGVTMTGKAGINAYGLKMIYEASDVPKTSTKASSSSSSRSSGSPSSSLPATTEPDRSETGTATPAPSSSNGISVGAQAAIGVIVPLFVIALGLGFFFWYRRRQRRFKVVQDDEPKELELNPVVPPSELYGTSVPPTELPAPVVISELPAEVPESMVARSAASPTRGEDPSSLSPSTALTASPATSHAAVSDAGPASTERGTPVIPTLTVSPAFSFASVSQMEPETESRGPDAKTPQQPPRP